MTKIIQNKLQWGISIALGVFLILFAVTTALADDINVDGDIVSPGNQSSVNLGTVEPGAILNPKVSFQLVCDSAKHVDYNQTITLTYNSSASTIPSDGSFNATTTTIGAIPTSWPDDTNGSANCGSTPPSPINDNGDSNVTIVAPLVPGDYTYTIKYDATLSPAGSNDSSAIKARFAQISFTLTVSAPADNTKPNLSLPGDLTTEATRPSGAVVTYAASASDPDDTVSTFSCTPVSGSTFALGTTTVNCSATDSHGNTAIGSFHVTVEDTIDPVITITATKADTSSYTADTWTNQTVTLHFECSDSGSGLAVVCPSDVLLSSDGVTTSVSGTVTDNAGNSADASFGPVKIDKTAPQLVSCDTPDGQWHAGDVTLKCTYTDGGSGPATQEVNLKTNVAAGTETADAAASANGKQACDGVGNCTASPADISGNKVDKKAPEVSCGSADSIWHATDQSVTCTATDGGSGPDTQSVTLSTSVADGYETDSASTNSQPVSDGVGNTTTAGPVGPFKIDKKAPSITIVVPVSGEYLLNQEVAANYRCEDGGSRVATCDGPVVNGGNIDTASVGSKTFKVDATDNVGNSFSGSVGYTVKYASGGFCYGAPGHTILQPINAEGTSVFKQKSTVPAKFRVCDANGSSIGTPGVVSSFRLVQIINGTVANVDEAVDSTAYDTAFRWSASDQQWIFNINTKNLAASKTYVYIITLNDGSTIQFQFGLK